MAWETRRLFGGLASTSLDLPWGFLPVCGSGLAKGLIGSCEILWSYYCNCIVFGCNPKGLIVRHVG